MAGIPEPRETGNGGGSVPWRVYERDRIRDDRDRDTRRRELDHVLADMRQEIREVREIAETVKDNQEADANQRSGKASVGKAIYTYVLLGIAAVVSIGVGVATLVVLITGSG